MFLILYVRWNFWYHKIAKLTNLRRWKIVNNFQVALDLDDPETRRGPVQKLEPSARSDPMADASLPAIRARSRPGTAIAAMMPMIATTISSSISVKPLLLPFLMSLSLMTAPSRELVVLDGQAAAALPALQQPTYLR